MRNYYSVYARGTDRPIFIHGTTEECCKALGINSRSFYKQIWRARQGRPSQKYEIFIDEDEEDVLE